MTHNAMTHPSAKALCTILGFVLLLPDFLPANPSGAKVVTGSVSLGQAQPGSLIIRQGTNKAIIHWNDFSIRQGELTRFIQPNASSVVLNRVVTARPSQIYGSLQANGGVYLINPNGILVGPGGRIDTQSFVASTLDISDGEFLRGGDFTFRGSSRDSVVNHGVIHAAGGDVFLLGFTVSNTGSIEAPQGTAAMAAGQEILLMEAGEERVFVRIGDSSASAEVGVHQAGLVEAARAELKAAGGNMYALAINNEGIVHAANVERKGGRIFLRAGGDVRNSGELNASGGEEENGGEIIVTGKTVDIAGEVNASGENGGTVFIGGGKQGNDAGIKKLREHLDS